MIILSENWYLKIFNSINPLSANITKWSNTLKQFVGKLPANCLSEFEHFVGLALKRLNAPELLNDLLVQVTIKLYYFNINTIPVSNFFLNVNKSFNAMKME